LRVGEVGVGQDAAGALVADDLVAEYLQAAAAQGIGALAAGTVAENEIADNPMRPAGLSEDSFPGVADNGAAGPKGAFEEETAVLEVIRAAAAGIIPQDQIHLHHMAAAALGERPTTGIANGGIVYLGQDAFL
jgi:hypothetical protein